MFSVAHLFWRKPFAAGAAHVNTTFGRWRSPRTAQQNNSQTCPNLLIMSFDPTVADESRPPEQDISLPRRPSLPPSFFGGNVRAL